MTTAVVISYWPTVSFVSADHEFLDCKLYLDLIPLDILLSLLRILALRINVVMQQVCENLLLEIETGKFYR